MATSLSVISCSSWVRDDVSTGRYSAGDVGRRNSRPNMLGGPLVVSSAASNSAGTPICVNFSTSSVMGWSSAACSISGASAHSVTSASLTGRMRRNRMARRCSECANTFGYSAWTVASASRTAGWSSLSNRGRATVFLVTAAEAGAAGTSSKDSALGGPLGSGAADASRSSPKSKARGPDGRSTGSADGSGASPKSNALGFWCVIDLPAGASHQRSGREKRTAAQTVPPSLRMKVARFSLNPAPTAWKRHSPSLRYSDPNCSAVLSE